jgi:LytS/YehU family sensor histidine kinase
MFFLNYPLALILGWFLAGKERAEASERELRELADRSRAQGLQAQLNPHVLFNVLGGLTELVHEDPDAAEEALVGLVEMYRELMRHGAALRAPLAHERALTTRYLGIEAIRLGARLQVRWQWPDWADPLELPPLLLLPLVENAIKHGIAPQIEGGAIHIELTRTPASLLLRVSNTGQPLKADYLTGTGLGNLKERLALLPAPRPTLRLETEGAWTVARLELPKRWPA